MLARLQQALCVAAVVVTAGLITWLIEADHALWAVLVAPLALAGYATALALEFALMRSVNRRHGVAVDMRECVRAWWGEVKCGLSVFAWRQPWRSARVPDRPATTDATQRGVVLVHGYFCNRGLWSPWLDRLDAAGVPFVAVNLEPVFGSIDDYVPIIDRAVERLMQSTGQAPVVVAHSMGGLAVRRWLVQAGNAGRATQVITLGSPHQGTWLARLAVSVNARQMRLNSAWLRRLAQQEASLAAPPFVCFYSAYDNIVFPAATATRPGADNRLLDGVAHVDMVHRDEPLTALMRAVSRS